MPAVLARAQVTSAYEDHEGTAVPASAVSKGYSTYAGRKYPTHVYCGDTHHHTANSGDAFTAGDRLTPEDSYRFARGQEVISSTGVPAKLSRPLDFLVVSDHAEGLGLMQEVYKGNPAFISDPDLARWSKGMKAGGDEADSDADEVTKAQAMGTLPGPIKDPKVVGPVMKSVWQQYTATAEKYNEPGRFTAMIGYEWTSVPGGNNLHRNVLFRDGKARADQVFPFSAWQSEDRRSSGRGWTTTRRRRAAGCSRSRTTPISRTVACSNRPILGPAAHARLRRASRALGSAAGDRPDERQQRNAPGDLAQRRVRG